MKELSGQIFWANNDNFLVNHSSFSLRQCLGNINSDSNNIIPEWAAALC